MSSGLAAIKTRMKWLAGSALRPPGLVTLNYHRIGDGRVSPYDPGLWSATAEDFDVQLRWLRGAFDVVSPRDLPQALRDPRGRHALVTFDDGYEDNFTAAFPVLRAHGLPATFFITTGFIDDGRCVPWWDELAWMVRTSRRPAIALPGHLEAPVVLEGAGRDRALQALNLAYRRVAPDRSQTFLDAVGAAAGTGRHREETAGRLWMTWDMIRELRDAGMTIGGHTVNHVMLSRLARDGQAREIAGCADRLRAELGQPMRAFSYPFGKPDTFNEDTRACLRDAGVELAFTYHGGVCRPGPRDDYAVPRIAIEQEHAFDAFRAEVLGAWFSRA